MKPSPAILKANQLLKELRAKRAKQAPDKVQDGLPWLTLAEGGGESQPLTLASLESAAVGFGSEAVTKALIAHERRQVNANQHEEREPALTAPARPAPRPPTSDPISAAGEVVLYPSLTLAIMRHKLASTGRLWLLFRYIDQSGKGWISLTKARRLLCDKGGALKLCKRRRLRQLLAAGRGIFWVWDKKRGRAWLKSPARVAEAMELERLQGRPVRLPVQALLAGMAKCRGALYSAFHVSREPEKGSSKPIARETLTKLTGSSVSSMIRYEEAEGIRVKHNYCIGDVANKEEIEQRAWAEGERYFVLKDHKGKQGTVGLKYSAWQLPNTYCTSGRGHHSRGRQRAHNKKLIGLCNNRGMRNDQGFNVLYYQSGQKAASAANRGDCGIKYWQGTSTRAGNGLWYFFD